MMWTVQVEKRKLLFWLCDALVHVAAIALDKSWHRLEGNLLMTVQTKAPESQFAYVVLAARRARQIMAGAPPMLENVRTQKRVRELDIVCTPARHASGRFLFDKDAKLWAGYAFVGAHHRAYFSGDTGLFPAMRDIGARLGPFDVTMIEVGQYHRAWPDWHIGPEQAITAHRMVRGKSMLPIHWALLALAYHSWTEPVERALLAAAKAGVLLATPRPGVLTSLVGASVRCSKLSK